MSTAAQRFRQIENRRRRLERKYIPMLQLAIRSQLRRFADRISSNPQLLFMPSDLLIQENFNSQIFDEVYTQMYTDTAIIFYQNQIPIIRKRLSSEVWVAFVQDYIRKNGGVRISQVNNFTKAYVLSRLKLILNKGIDEGLGIEAISKLVVENIEEYSGKFAMYRAERIARTEIVGVSNWASLESARTSGVSDLIKKKWLVTQDDRTRDTHLAMENHPAIGFDERFTVPKDDGTFDLMLYPGDPDGSAENVINCRCTVVYERK